MFQSHRPGGSIEDLRNITHTQVASIYRSDYWDKCRCDDLPVGIDYVVFDGAVNSGPAQSARWLQRAVGTTDDGLIGTQTIAATVAAETDVAIQAMCAARLTFLEELPTWSTFGRGWQRRVDEVRDKALSIAGFVVEPAERIEILRLGSRGDAVLALQTALGISADGIFGPGTEQAVRSFQRRHDLADDGVAGPATQAAIRAGS